MRLTKLINKKGIVAVSRDKDVDKTDYSLLLMLATLERSDKALDVLKENSLFNDVTKPKNYTIKGADQPKQLKSHFFSNDISNVGSSSGKKST